MKSVWSKETALPAFDSLSKDMKTDVLVIGGGMAGILCAYMLEQAGVSYILVEADRICSGITKNTTAKITSQHGLVYDKLIHQFGVDRARLYLLANEKALKEYRRLCEKLECDFEDKDAFVYSQNNVSKIEKELKALEKLGYPATFSDRLPLPFSVAGAVKFNHQAQFNPLKFVAAISKGLKIYEHTMAQSRSGKTVVTDHGKITADQTIVTTHFPFINTHGSYFLKMYQHRSYVIALENGPQVGGMYVDESQTGLSFRNYKDLLLLGGGAHRTGKQGGGWQELEDFAGRNYPGAHEKYRWATQDCMTLDHVPYIGQYSACTPDLYVAAGFNKWGMTSSMAAAIMLTDRVLGRKNQYESVFSPSRSMFRPQLAANALEAVSNLVGYSNRRCTHMGCALKWNAQEHSWDCPCHGSRFTEDGRLIDNPAMRDKNLGARVKP